MARVWCPKDAPEEVEWSSSARRRQRREKEKTIIEAVFEKLQNLQTQIHLQANVLDEIKVHVQSGSNTCEPVIANGGGGVWTCLSDTTYFVEVPRIQYVEKVIEVPRFVIDSGHPLKWEPLEAVELGTAAKHEREFAEEVEIETMSVHSRTPAKANGNSVSARGSGPSANMAQWQKVVQHGRGKDVSIGFNIVASGDRLRLPFKDQEPVKHILEEFCKQRSIDRNNVKFQIWGEKLSGEETWKYLQRKHRLDAADGEEIDVVKL